MKSFETEHIALQLLASLGLHVERVPRANSKTPDFAATDPMNGRYVIEVKTRWDSDDFRRAFASDGHAMSDVRLDHSNSVTEHLDHASGQIAARRASDADFSLVCYVIVGSHPDMQGEQLRNTLWGAVRLIDLDDLSFSKPCFYLGRGAFNSHPDIDGVFAMHPLEGRAGLYLNAFSGRRIEQSFLGAALARNGAVFSAEEAAAKGAVLLANPSIGAFRDRLRDVQVRTGRRKLSPMHSMGWHGDLRVSREDIGGM
jgi:hypothetical protein